jgi:hypothetical protein
VKQCLRQCNSTNPPATLLHASSNAVLCSCTCIPSLPGLHRVYMYPYKQLHRVLSATSTSTTCILDIRPPYLPGTKLRVHLANVWCQTLGTRMNEPSYLCPPPFNSSPSEIRHESDLGSSSTVQQASPTDNARAILIRSRRRKHKGNLLSGTCARLV